ncbi:hypothetical protein AHAS_Ahas14G0174200 [Arachis hypogaea]
MVRDGNDGCGGLAAAWKRHMNGVTVLRLLRSYPGKKAVLHISMQLRGKARLVWNSIVQEIYMGGLVAGLALGRTSSPDIIGCVKWISFR